MVKLVFLADTHRRHDQLGTLPDGDILIHIGDFCNSGEFWEGMQFMDWFEQQPHKTKILVAGNHDCFLDENHVWYSAELKKRVKENVIYLENSSCKVHGLNFFGWPYVAYDPHGSKWAFTPQDEEPDPPTLLIPADTDIVLSHCPPYGILDIGWGNRNIGCMNLLEAVDKVRPTIHAFGHCHEQRGAYYDIDTKTRFMNVTTHGKYGEPLLEPVVIDVDPSKLHRK